ncbi:N-acylglucosamine 2-epimerase [Nonomuraea sp. MG754425]|uniref:AGE family epimerase/isomerase n=1 Tax=Nonomuraea sp. MG754425 TaxID=2570319 RepID=UPI001F38054A|nr:AGE family epimerase/isomerase [Nonomuraea sp. MG754425]MCF6467057.1 N-acylglucosamine 2-epimerase [Nonomuraea sp. MG754425]
MGSEQPERPERIARRQLEDVILPFWLENGIDTVHGGFYTCFDNRGRRRLSTDKFTWSQGRFVWLLARAARLAERGLLDHGRDPRLDPGTLVRHAERGAAFLLDHAVGPDGRCAYVVDERGEPLPGERSIFADAFVAMGLAELTRQTGSPEHLPTIDLIVQRIADDVAAGDPPTPPYPLPPGCSGFGARMIVLNARLDQVRAHQAASTRPGSAPVDELREARRAMLAHREDSGLFTETFVPDPGRRDTVLARHRTPGHALEGTWIAMEAGDLLGESADHGDLVAGVSALCRAGWDDEHGGLFRYVDVTGPSYGGPYEDLVRRTWSTKLWWVHSEAAYATLLAAERHGDREAAGWFDRIWDYTLRTFPGGADGEEWIQIRDRSGAPFDEVVALPVKDPYHIARNLMQIVELRAQGDQP